MVQPLINAGVDKRMIDVFAIRSEQYKYYPGVGDFSIDEIPHNVRNCAWNYMDAKTGERLFYATDCATLDGIEAKNYDLYMIEANHDRAEIEARIAAKHAAGEFAYEESAARNHLSREQAEDWLARNVGPNSKYVFLHQHRGA